MDWFYITLGFLCLNHFIAIVGVVVYLRKEKKWWIIALLFASPFIIIAPLLFDVCMPFYRLLQNWLPDEFVTFMVQYEATRTLSESFIEGRPIILRSVEPILSLIIQVAVSYTHLTLPT